MRKIILLVQASLLVSFCALSQEINLTWGPEKEFAKSNNELGFVGRVKDHFYTLRKQDKTMYLAKTRIRDMSQVFDKPITWNDERKNAGDEDLKYHSFRLFKDHFMFYFEGHSSKEDMQRLYAQKLNFEGVPIDEMKEIGRRPKGRRSKDGDFELKYSADSIHFVVVTHPSYEKYNDELFYFKILNNHLKELHNVEVVLPFKEKDVEVQSITMTKKQVLHVLAKITIGKKERKDDEASYYYEIVSIDPKAKQKVKEFEVKLANRYVDDVDLILDEKDNLKCFGFYAEMKSNGKRKDGIDGVFFFSVANGQISNVSLKAFEASLILEIEGKKRANRNKGLGSYFSLKNLFLKPDGGMIVLAEESYVQVVTTTSSNGGSSTSYHYYYNSILAVNISPKGDIIWYSHVPKKQALVNENRFGSFHSMYVNRIVYIIYNDDIKNAIMKNYDNQMRNYLKCAPVVVTINQDGKSDKKSIGDPAAKKEFTIKPNASDKISEHEAFFYADRLSKAPCVIGKRKTRTQRFGLLSI